MFIGGTRWLPHIDLAIDNFIKGYIPIKHHLETASHENAKAEGLVKIATDGNLLVFLLSLRVCKEYKPVTYQYLSKSFCSIPSLYV